MPNYLENKDVIAAIATAHGRAGIGVVRVSGKDILHLIKGILDKLPKPRLATYSNFFDVDGNVIDKGIALYFRSPHSYTGEDVLELQGHGGPQILQMVLDRCLELGARLAEPGEFSRRAFLNDKIDLAQAESIADLIDAQSREAARSAVRSLTGEFSRTVNELINALIKLRILVEATLDFPEEEIDFLVETDAYGQLNNIESRLHEILKQAHQGALLRDGFNVVLIGQPNVGKSTLLNKLAGYEAAIVTEIAGTTRDTLREVILIDGMPLHITDTAGLRETEDPIEEIGIKRTWLAVDQADVALLLVDAHNGLGDQEARIIECLPAIPLITLHNKIDLIGKNAQRSIDKREIWLSARTGAGIDLLKQSLLHLAGWQSTGEGTFMARKRHLDALNKTKSHLNRAQQSMSSLDLFAEELRLAQLELTYISGEFGADELLGEIFGRFCIGK